MKPIPQVRHNIIANFSGKAVAAVFSLAFVPVYIRLMGVEVYGLIGVFVSLGAILSLLDMGLSATLSREMSRMNGQTDVDTESRNLVRTFELIYWTIGLLLGLVVLSLAPLVTAYWINASTVDSKTVERAIMIMGVSIALQWPGSMYAGGLMGLQRQVGLNVIRTVMVMIQHGGAVLLLVFISPSILLFFLWQALAGLVTTIALAHWLWKSLPPAQQKTKFDINLLTKNWRFAAGMTGISIVTVLLTQMDKIILSKMLSLESFGYYVLAFNVANALQNLVTPIFTALYPKFTQLVSGGDERKLINLYHLGCQFLSAVVLPVAVGIAVFSREILELWLGHTDVASHAYPILTLLIIGTALNAVMTLPYGMQLAYGKTKIILIANVLAVIFLIPVMVLLVQEYKGLGAAWAWIILNIGYIVFLIPVLHRTTLKHEMRMWYWEDNLLPGLVVCVIVGFGRLLIPSGESLGAFIALLLGAMLMSFICVVLLSNHLKSAVFQLLPKRS